MSLSPSFTLSPRCVKMCWSGVHLSLNSRVNSVPQPGSVSTSETDVLGLWKVVRIGGCNPLKIGCTPNPPLFIRLIQFIRVVLSLISISLLLPSPVCLVHCTTLVRQIYLYTMYFKGFTPQPHWFLTWSVPDLCTYD